MNKLMFVLLLSVVAFGAMAHKRSPEDALTAAAIFQAKRLGKDVVITKVDNRHNYKYAIDPKMESGYYIFNDSTNHSFVVVSADESMEAVLGYSDSSVFDAYNCPEGLLDLLNYYQAVYDGCTTKASVSPDARRSTTTIAPMITTKWGQAYPYNAKCPKYRDRSCMVGCMAVAVSQVMNYHKYPERGKGEITYKPGSLEIEHMDFSKHVFDWDNMADEIDENSSPEQIEAVANLLNAVGHGLLTDYGPYESGSIMGDDAYALSHYFGYNTNIQSIHRKYYTDEEWIDIIDNEIECGRPLIFDAGGYRYTNELFDDKAREIYGHAFVLDGRDAKGYYHFNFGWQGLYDGYYLIDAITPQELLFDVDQTVVIGVSPELTGEKLDDFGTHFLYLGYDKTTGKLEVNTSIVCYSNQAQTPGYNGRNWDIAALLDADFYFGILDHDFCMIDTLASYGPYGFAHGVSIELDGKIDFDISKYTEGQQFYIAPCMQVKGSDKMQIYRDNRYSKTRWYLATVSNGDLILSPEGIIGAVDNPKIEDFYIVIDCAEAGSLARYVDNKVKGAKTLTITGDINGDDIVTLQKILDLGNIVELDFKNANIVEGGSNYADGYVTEEDVFGSFFIVESPSLREITIPQSIKSIEYLAFKANPKLKHIDIPEGCQYINSAAFFNNRKLESITIPSTVNDFSNTAGIQRCPSLQRIDVSDTSTYYTDIDGVVYTKDLGTLMFYPSAHSCVDYVLPTETKKIDSYAFASSGLRSIVLHDDITSIDYNAFDECDSLKNIKSHIIDMSQVNVGYAAFMTIPADCKWTIGRGCSEFYTSCKWWRDSWIIEEVEFNSSLDTVSDINTMDLYDLRGTYLSTVPSGATLTARSLGIAPGVYILGNKKVRIGN